MADLLQEAPSGFAAAGEEFGRFAVDLKLEICLNVLHYIEGEIAALEVSDLRSMKNDKDATVAREHLYSTINAIVYIFRFALKHGLSAAELSSVLLKSSCWNQSSSIETIRQVYSDYLERRRQLPATSNMSAASFAGIGRLIDMQWKLGMSMTSSNCRQLNSPYIDIMMKVSDASGQTVSRSFEMTLTEFKNFSSQMRDIAGTLRTV